MRKFIQITYIILFFITSFMMIRTLNLGNPIPKMLLIVYFISAFLSLGKAVYCLIIDYINQYERN